MRTAVLFLVLLLAPGLAQAHAGVHGGNQTHGSGSGDLQPGAWPPPGNATAGNATTTASPGGGSAPVVPVGFEPTVTSPASRDWVAFKGGPARTGASPAKAPLAPQRAWDVTPTAGVGLFAPPVVADGTVVVAGLDRKVTAIDLATGFKRWDFPLPAMAHASPAIADDKVLVQAVNGTLVALDLPTGQERWRVELGQKTSASPLVQNGIAYTATEDGQVVALDIGDGKLRWNRTIGPLQSTVSPAFAAGRLILGDERGMVWGLHALTGQVLWTASVGTAVTATPVIAGKLVVVPTYGLRALEVETGKQAWAKPLAAFVRSSPAYQAGVLVYGDPEAPGVAAVSALNGQPTWDKPVPTRLFVRSSPSIAQDIVLAAADDGSLLAMRLRNGTVLWTLDAGERMRASPVVLDGKVLAARMDGVLRLYEDPGQQAAADEAAAAPARDGLLDLLPVFVALAVPYVGLKVLRQRMREAVLAPPAPPPMAAAPPEAQAAVEQARRQGFVRVTCPRCACLFGVSPQRDAVVQCPGCGLRSEVRRRKRPGLR